MTAVLLAVAVPLPPAEAFGAARRAEAPVVVGEQDGGRSAPTVADLATQQQRLAELQAAVAAQTTALATARAQLAAASLAAAAALEASALATRELQDAQLTEQRERTALLAAQLELAAQRRLLGRWAREAYRGGGGLAANPELVTLLESQSTDDVGVTLQWLRRVGRSKSRAVESFDRAQVAQAAAARSAAAATLRAEDAATTAAAAKEAADRAVAQQKRAVQTQATLLAETVDEAAQAQQQTMSLRAARAIAAARAGGARSVNRVTGPVGECTGRDVQGYPNGEIPFEALCPIWAAPGQALRADAAYAFDQLSDAFARTFGKPPCVTDSYRSYTSQVDLYARKPTLAAVPGTSNHGWGTAVDLCGGIERFATPQHEWMVVNAPMFGWFHPSWAGPAGSRPEPWHFEFGG